MPRPTHELVYRVRELAVAALAGSPPAALELTTLRDSLRVRDLQPIDQALRSTWAEDGWTAVKPDQLKRLPSLPFGAAAAQFLACHPDGHVREAAIRTFAVASDGGEVAFLLLRANDWVPPVRHAAVAALRARLRPALAPALVRALPLLERMRGWQRLDEPGLLDALDALPGPAELAAGLASPDLAVRRTCARRLAARGFDDAAIERALGDRDSVTRRIVARWLCTEAGPRFDAHAPRLLADRLGSIRRDALAVALRRGAAAAPFLADPHAGVRGLAQAHLVAAGDDVAARYRAMLAEGSSRIRAIALVGLADAATARAHLADPEPQVRAAALAAAVAVRLPDLHDVLIAALTDPSPSPRRIARRNLIPKAIRLRPAAIWAAFRDDGKRAALAVLARCDYWPRLPYLLRATADPDLAIGQLAQVYVSQWLARRERVFTAPSAGDVAAIHAALAGATLSPYAARAVATAVATPPTSRS